MLIGKRRRSITHFCVFVFLLVAIFRLYSLFHVSRFERLRIFAERKYYKVVTHDSNAFLLLKTLKKAIETIGRKPTTPPHLGMKTPI